MCKLLRAVRLQWVEDVFMSHCLLSVHKTIKIASLLKAELFNN